MNHDFEDQLRLTLRDRAGNVDDSRDLSRAAIGQARTIRRNRNRLTVAASVAAVAAVVPVVLFTGDRLAGDAPVAPPSSISPTATPSRTPGAHTSVAPSTPSRPTTSVPPATRTSQPARSTLDLTKLPRGEAPRTVYLDGRTVVTPAGRVQVPGTGLIDEAVYGDGRVFVTTERGMLELRIGGGSGPVVPGVSELQASADRRAVAYAVVAVESDGVTARPGALHYRSGGTRSRLDLPPVSEVTIYAVVGGQVYFAVRDADGTGLLQRWTAGERAAVTLDAVAFPSFVSADGTLAGVPIGLSGSDPRYLLVDVPDGGNRWRSTEYSLQAIAGDAVLVESIKPGRIGSEVFGVLDKATGQLRYEWRGLVLDTAVESADSVLAVVEQDGKHALVRCRVAIGRCELAGPLADGVGGGPEPPRFRLGT